MFLPGQPDRPLPSAGIPGDHRSPIDTAGLWGYESYEAILYGMQFLGSECDAWFGANRPAPRVLKRVLDKLRLAPTKLPPHAVWLQRVLGMPFFATAAGARGR
jgi:tryptophan halogenase